MWTPPLPPGHWSQTEGLLPYFERIAEVTEGRVRVEASGAPLAPPTRNFQAAVDGIADVVWGPHGYHPGAFPLSELVEFPFLTTDPEAASIAYWRTWEEHLQPTGMQEEVVTLAMHVTSGGNLHLRGDPVTTAAELDGLKIRVPNALVGRALRDLGAVPISAPLTDLREMLSRGIVDGLALSDEFVFGFNIADDISSVTYFQGGIFTSSGYLAMSRSAWDQISPEDQEAIMAISGETLSAQLGALWHQYDLQAREELISELGDAYVEADEAFQVALEGVFASEWQDWLSSASEAGVDGEVVAEFYRAEMAAEMEEVAGTNDQ